MKLKFIHFLRKLKLVDKFRREVQMRSVAPFINLRVDQFGVKCFQFFYTYFNFCFEFKMNLPIHLFYKKSINLIT